MLMILPPEKQLELMRHEFDVLQQRLANFETDNRRLHRNIREVHKRMDRLYQKTETVVAENRILQRQVHSLQTALSLRSKIPGRRPLVKRESHLWMIATGIFAVLAVLAIIVPKDVSVNGWSYSSEALPPEALAAVPPLLTAAIAFWRRQKEKEDDKE